MAQSTPSPIARPCFIVIDREHSGTLSMRKLVIESAKFNVITAYSGAEALQIFDRFPAVDAVILNASTRDVPCTDILTALRQRAPRLPIIVVQGPGGPECPGADRYIDSFDPVQLLELLRELFPRASEVIRQHDDVLKLEENQG